MKTKQFLVIFGWLVVGGFYLLLSQNPKTSQEESALKQTSVEISKPLSLGWTWFSLNVQGADMTLGNVLNSLGAQDGDYIKNQTVSATYYAGIGWFGELTQIDPKEMYKIKLSHAANLLFSGDPVDIGSHPITINIGWNWIGYLPQSAKTVAEALSTLSPVADDYIKNQTESSTFYDGSGWFGELSEMVPLDGYMLKTSHSGTLIYPEPSSCSFTDVRDGKTYACVEIGTQTWMAENLAWLPSVSPSSEVSETTPYNYVYGYEGSSVSDAKTTANYSTYGVLYNWEAAKAACPAGWHLPTDEDWKVLEKNQGMTITDADAEVWRNTGSVGGKLKEAGTSHWISPNTGAVNTSGFTALPGSYSTSGGFYYLGSYASFWSASEKGWLRAWGRILSSTDDGVLRLDYDRFWGFSVRCVFYATITGAWYIEMVSGNNQIGTLGQQLADSIKVRVKDSNGNPFPGAEVAFSANNGGYVIPSGVTTDADGIASAAWTFGSTDNIQTVSAIAFKSDVTTPLTGSPLTFTASCRCAAFVAGGYEAVRIGTQVWMAKNLNIPTANSLSSGFATPERGRHYFWEDALTACPDGWHLPSDDEWTTLTTFLGGEELAGGKLKEAGTTHWASPNNGATNSSCFTAVPGGVFWGGQWANSSDWAYFWSATGADASHVWSRSLYSDSDRVSRGQQYPNGAFSVRCVWAVGFPIVNTADITAITQTSALSGGNVIDDGGEPVIGRGVCWNTTGSPTTTDSKTTDGSGSGSFTSTLTGLTVTQYYVRAYATYSAGTAYGEQIGFNTGGGTFTDARDGHVYKTVINGTQTWMAENLAYLPSVSPSSEGSFTTPYNYVYGYDGSSVSDAKSTANYGTYGVLYNWEAAKAACPSGWHLPTDEEWKVLEKYQGMTIADADATGWRNTGTVGGKFKETRTTHWISPNTGAVNISGFTALPGGYSSDFGFFGLGSWAYFWSASKIETWDPWSRRLDYGNDGVRRDLWDHHIGISVRCLLGANLPMVTTTGITAITETSASSGGNVTYDGGGPVTGRGVCWNTTGSPTIADSKTTDGTGSGLFTSTLTGLAGNTTYYVRAYATNSAGTAYGEQKEIKTPEGTFYYDGRRYAYKTIGTQVWMVENLAYLPSVSPSSEGSETTPYNYVYGYEGSSVSDAKATDNYGTYGVLYNWEAAKTACPSGWHLPTDEEWKVLEKDQGMTIADADATGWRNTGTVGGKLKEAGTSHWISPNTGAVNTSGFTVLPGGSYNDVGFFNLGYDANFWSASGNGMSGVWIRYLHYGDDGVRRHYYDHYYGFSVRCLLGESLPMVTTMGITAITEASASSGGNIIHDGGAMVTARGVCWSTSLNPTTDNSKTTDGTGSGSFTSTLTGLTGNTTYYVRAYATNSVGTAYGEQIGFDTSGGTFTDPRDGHVYKTVIIGTQTWMAENLAYLPSVSPSSEGSETSPYNYVYGYEGSSVSDAKTTANYGTYGVLYNWEAAKTACPSGWHLPTDEEWKVLEKDQGMTITDADATGWRNTGTVGGKLKEAGTSHWISPNTGAVNTSGFTALPGGYSNSGGFNNIGNNTYFWSASGNGTSGAWVRHLYYLYDGVGRYDVTRDYGFSVRCLLGANLPMVTTMGITAITETSASSGGNIIHDGGAMVTARGVCWSTSLNPTTDNSKTTDGTGSGSFTSALTGLAGNTTYYVRAYATNSAGTSYGEQIGFNTVGGTGTFTDARDGHVYKTVIIGTQTWMAENLAYLPSVSPSLEGSETTPYNYVYGYEGSSVSDAKTTANYGTYGVLYNWEAAKTACPSGWHLPTDEEWKVLEKYQGMTITDANATGWRNTGTVGGKLKEKGTTHWKSPNTGAVNTSGFTSLPGGYCGSEGFRVLGYYAYFWSASENGTLRACLRDLDCNHDGVNRGYYYRDFGLSARCLQND